MIKRLVPLVLAASACAAHAADFSTLGALSQDELLRLSRDLGAAISYKGVTPATPLGLVGFDVGVEVTDTKMESSDAFSRAGAGGQSHLVIPKLHVYKGLPAGFDIGAFIGGSSDVSATVFGADLRYAILDDGLATPAVAVRLSGTKAAGLGDLSVNTIAFDAMVSKKLAFFTPYAGAGSVRVQSTAHNTALQEVTFNKGRVFGGLNVNLVGANLALEAEKMGGNTSLSAKLGLRF
jgi:hypothetical protein